MKMTKFYLILPLLLLLQWVANAQIFNGTLRIDPKNPRFFTDNSGKAILLTGSHTWANFQDIGLPNDKPFDWKGYLEMLKTNNHNFIRLWVWEQAKKASWTQDEIVFSPLPYQTVQQNGKTKYDLSKWNEAYFQRLRQRVTEAGQYGFYVSVMLFQGWSQNKTRTPHADPWEFHPFNPANNINGVGKAVENHHEDDERKPTLHSLKNGDVLAHQEAYVKKVVETLNDLDNVLYEILNEGGLKDWQYHIINQVKKVETNLPKKHPVGMSHAIALYPPMLNEDLWNSPADWISPTKEPNPWFYPGCTVLDDYQNDPPANMGNKVIINDTDHLWGHGGNPQWVWKSFLRGLNPVFMDPWQNLAGRLDKEKMEWMFIKGGIAKDDRNYPDWEPIRQNMGYIRRYAERMNLAKMIPQNELSSTKYCLANTGEEYLIYFPQNGTATLNLRAAKGEFEVEWFIPMLNRTLKGAESVKGGDYVVLTAPFSAADVVLYLKKK
ncbi:MAG: DUF4038 domain-containing protein [Thermoflexibacter sp.]|jgi:hypothetical protein|nr:DUF4038 domain-containing protein [Thermoflexibacter sp.]